MKNLIFTAEGVWINGSSVIRMLTGVLLIVHSTQMFIAADMAGYTQWLTDLHFPMPEIMAYSGKVVEMVGGICFVLGIFTRIASLLVILTFATITFTMGHGKILTDAQHPFLFAMLAMIFFFSGPGKWSLDHKLFGPQ